MKSLTIHNMDNVLADRIEQMALKTGKSRNKVIKEILSRALGLNIKEQDRIDTSMIAGTMSEEDLGLIESSIKIFDEVDLQQW